MPSPRYRVLADPATPIDTTGAGDAFSGALAASLAQREADFAEHVRFAARYAARSTEREGAATAMPPPSGAQPAIKASMSSASRTRASVRMR